MPAYDDRDEVLDAFNEGRAAIAEFGLRRVRVYLRTRRWFTGSVPPWATSSVRGRGSPIDTEVELVPTPRVRDLSAQYIVSTGGRFVAGDIKVDKITPLGLPGSGVELWPFVQVQQAPDEERHVILVQRSGTAWHVREGTDRLLVSAPFNGPSAVIAANALRLAIPGHWSDPYAHLAGDASPAPGSPATDFASAQTLANLLRAAWLAHRSDTGLHPVLDEYPVGAPVATDGQSTLVLLHELLRVFNLHVAPGPVRECAMIEAHADRAFASTILVRPTRRTPQ